MAALALLATGAACTGQPNGLRGAAVPQASDTVAEQPAAPQPAEGDAAEDAEPPAAATDAEQPAGDTTAEQPVADTPEEQAAADAVAAQLAEEAAAAPVAVEPAAVEPAAVDDAAAPPSFDAAAEQAPAGENAAVSTTQQSWSVAIEQNPMSTSCGTTSNIPVAGATDCATAKVAAWNLLMTLFQTPGCMNPGCPLASVAQGVSTCVAQTYTTPTGQTRTRWQVSWTWVCVPPPLPCPRNLLTNGNFATAPVVVGNGSMPPSTVTGWLRAFGSPQLSSAMGHGNNGFVYMWGNRVVGEGIRQALGTPLVAGAQYSLSASVSWLNSVASPQLPPYVQFKVRASNGALPNYTAGTASQTIGTIGLTPGSVPPPVAPGITSTNWMNVTLPNWTAPAAGLNTITINPENASSVNDGAQVSWGRIDNVCLRRVPMPCVLDPGMVSAGNTFARRIVLAQTFTPTQSGSLTKITHGLQSISTVANYDLLITKTAGNGTPAWTGTPGAPYNGSPDILYKATGLTTFATSAQVNAAVAIPANLAPYLTAGTKYALVLIPGTPTTGHMAWRGNSSAASYPNGSAYELVGTTWSVPATGPKDHGFKLDGQCP